MIRSGYSFRTACGHLPDVADRVKEIGWTTAPLADRMSTFAFNKWAKECKARALRPVYGVELAAVPELGEKRPRADYWKFLAVDALRPLHDLIYQATNNPGREPSLTYAQALAADGVFVVAGERCLTDALPASLHHRFSQGLSPATPKGLIKRTLARGIPLFATTDNYYPRREDEELYRLALGSRRSSTQTYPRWILSDDELRSWFADEMELDPDLIDGAFARRDKTFFACTATIPQASFLEPERPAPLLDMCKTGAERLGVTLNPAYQARLDHELSVIESKGLEAYFYVMADLIGWARERMVVGPARGSSCGSLVCYLLGITTVDPMPYGLLFERFLSPDRNDPPDIDSDFDDTQRARVFEYAEQKYGADHVARLGTVGLFRGRSVMKQIGAELRIPQWRLDKVDIIERQPGDVRHHLCVADTLKTTDQGQKLLVDYPEFEVAGRLEGHPNVASQHAAGLLITAGPIAEYVAVDARTKAAWTDKKDAETQGLLKIDVLGLTQLSVFARCLDLIGKPPSFLNDIPLDDPIAFDVLNSGHSVGLFQFSGSALKAISSQVRADCLDDIVAMTALARPGPMAGGASKAWIRRKRKEEGVMMTHSLLAGALSETYGVIVYQEQVMQICRDIGDMSWEDVSAVRRAMGLRLGDEMFGKFWTMFRDGAVRKGLSEDTARSIWVQMEGFASYAFNKSHSVAYGIVSYWCCWLKAHHPVEFAAATLDAESDPSKQLALLRELHAEGIEYVPVDAERSTERWEIAERNGKTILVGPLVAIRGIGPGKVREIMDARRAGAALRPALLKQIENAQTDIDHLFPIDAAIKRLHPDLSAINIFSEPTPVIKVQPGIKGDFVILVRIDRITLKNENDAQSTIKRGRSLIGPTDAINLFCSDDGGEIFAKIDRFQYEKIGIPFLAQAKAGKSLFALRGNCPVSFRMVSIKNVRYLGEIKN